MNSGKGYERPSCSKTAENIFGVVPSNRINYLGLTSRQCHVRQCHNHLDNALSLFLFPATAGGVSHFYDWILRKNIGL